MENVQIIIVGAGPGGLAAAVEAKEAGFEKVVVLEKSEHHCNTIITLFREGKRVDAVYRNIMVEPLGKLSFTTETREDFLKRMDEVVVKYDPDIRYGEECLNISRGENGYSVATSGALTLNSPVVVIAIGVFGRPVKPSYPIPRDVRQSVHYSLPEIPLRGKNVLVVGGGDTAAETSCFLSGENKVTLSYRRTSFFRINEKNLCDLNTCYSCGSVDLKKGTDISSLEAEESGVRVAFDNNENLVFDEIFYCLGGSTPQDFLKGAGVRFEGNKPVIDQFGETNLGGLFLTGDLVAEKGSIMAAFNSGKRVVERIIQRYPGNPEM